jgi:hypothetical protein
MVKDWAISQKKLSKMIDKFWASRYINKGLKQG